LVETVRLTPLDVERELVESGLEKVSALLLNVRVKNDDTWALTAIWSVPAELPII
jgi:hypothetical protein